MTDTNSAKDSALDDAIADVLLELRSLEADSEAHAAATKQLVKLHKLKMDEKAHQLDSVVKTHEIVNAFRRKPVSYDTIALAAANLAGIALIIWHERDHVMNRTALDYLKRLR